MTTKRITEELPKPNRLQSTVRRSPRNKRRKVIVTIIESTGEKHWPMEFEIDGFQLTEDMGIKELEENKFESNGQYRGCFKFWRGCESYEDFVAHEGKEK